IRVSIGFTSFSNISYSGMPLSLAVEYCFFKDQRQSDPFSFSSGVGVETATYFARYSKSEIRSNSVWLFTNLCRNISFTKTFVIQPGLETRYVTSFSRAKQTATIYYFGYSSGSSSQLRTSQQDEESSIWIYTVRLAFAFLDSEERRFIITPAYSFTNQLNTWHIEVVHMW
ncbi:MAG: hypothetical protein AAB393_17505, partial [Bacteroidota bacterium]